MLYLYFFTVTLVFLYNLVSNPGSNHTLNGLETFTLKMKVIGNGISVLIKPDKSDLLVPIQCNTFLSS